HTRSKRDWSSDVCSSDLQDIRFSVFHFGFSFLPSANGQEAHFLSVPFLFLSCSLFCRGTAPCIKLGLYLIHQNLHAVVLQRLKRSEERRVGNECRCGASE